MIIIEIYEGFDFINKEYIYVCLIIKWFCLMIGLLDMIDDKLR